MGLCDVDELKTLFLFEKLDDRQLAWLCAEGRVEELPVGFVYREGEPATCFYVLIEGSLTMSRRVGEDDVEIVRSSNPGVYAGAFQAYLGDRIRQTYTNSMRITEPSRFFVLDAELFAQLMRDWFPMALHVLEGLFFGTQSTQQAVEQRERLLALGSLSAGLTHELNNPAAAAVRATSLLRERVDAMRHKLASLAAGPFDHRTLQAIVDLQEVAVERVAGAVPLTPMQAADREDELGQWLEAQGVADGWELATVFVQAGLDQAFLDRIAATVGSDQLGDAVRWISCSVDAQLLLNEIEDSTTRVSTLVGAAKQYSQMDRSPYQIVDVHELLDSTLLMLSGKLGPDITVVKEYDRSLPAIPAFAGELNQVWTNTIDNAVAAMGGSGTLTIRTSKDEEYLLVEIGDTGPGVPEEIRSRIFEPFFTTKPFGEGTGLGLDISWRIVVNKHHGDLRVESTPGDTRFQVRLPLVAPARTELSTAVELEPPSG
jgi:signal transduction histidine kinase